MSKSNGQEPWVHFRCLGPLSVTVDGGRVVPLRTRKLAAVLLMLARQPGKAVSREYLTDLLWSEDDEGKARHSLSHAVSLINKTLGREVVAAPQRDQLMVPEGMVRLDLLEFEQTVREGRWEDAQLLWRGNLLEGTWIRGVPNFDRWLEGERQRLARAMRDVQREVIEDCRVAGDWEGMRANAEFLLTFDPLDETAMLGVVEALGLAGDRTQALRRYGEFEHRLKDELGAEPNGDLKSWARRSRRGDTEALDPKMLQRIAAARVAESIALPAPTPVFGREEEFAELWQAWEAAKTGRGCFYIMRGEAGIGKTALATKLASQIHVSGGSVCFVRCYKSEKAVPFAPISTLIRQLSRLPGFVATGEVWIGEMTRLVPELRERFPHVPQPIAVDDAARHRLCDAALQAAECVADEHPLFIVVDDIHDADEATLALVHYLGRQLYNQAIVLVTIARSTSALSEPLALFLGALSLGFARSLALGDLDDGTVQLILRQALAQRHMEVPQWAHERLVGLVGGNPLRALEAALAIPSQAGLSLAEYGEKLSGILGAGESIDGTAGQRLNRLPDTARSVAGAMAVCGRPMTDFEIAAVTKLTTSDYASAVFELDAARYIIRSGRLVSFSHEHYSELVLEGLGAQEREKIHLALARLLDASATPDPTKRYEVAVHLAGGGQMVRARTEALAAADYAESIGAVREEAQALELVLNVSSSFDIATACRLASCYLGLGMFAEVSSLCQRARTGPLSFDTEAEVAYLEATTQNSAASSNLTSIRDSLLSILDRGLRFRSEASAYITLLRVAERLGDRQLVIRTARDLRRRSRVGGVKALHAAALVATAFVGAKYYRPKRSLMLLEKALEIAHDTRDWELQQSCKRALGAVLRQLGRFTEARLHFEAAVALARTTLSPQSEADGLMDAAVAEIALGNYGRASDLLNQSMAIDRQFSSPAHRAFRLVNYGETKLALAEIDEAGAAFATSYNLASEVGLWRIRLIAAGGLAVCAQRRGDVDGLRQAVGLLLSCQPERRFLLADRWLVEAAIAWDLVLRDSQDQAFEQLDRAISDLAHRDIDQWMCLQLEAVKVHEYVRRQRATERRLTLAQIARQYQARGVESAASS